MTCRSHPWTYPAENGHSSHDHSASLHCLLSGWSERLSRGEPWQLVRAAYCSRYPNGGRQARLHGPDQGASPREDSRIERQHAIIYRGFESVVRYHLFPTPTEPAISYPIFRTTLVYETATLRTAN